MSTATAAPPRRRHAGRRQLHGAVLAHYAVLRDYGWPRREASRRARRAASLPLHHSQRPYRGAAA